MITVNPPKDDRGTLLDLFDRNVADFPHVTALIDGDTRLTWGEYGDLSTAVALAFDDLGVRRGDVVGLQMMNRHEHVVADTAGLRLGATPTSFYNTLAPDQLVYVAGDCKAKVLVVDADKLDMWLKIRDQLPALEHIVVHDLEDVPDGVTRWEDLVARGRELHDEDGAQRLAAFSAEVQPDNLVTIIYTSGTTGPPKGVLLTHAGMRWDVETVGEIIKKGMLTAGRKKFADWIVDGHVELRAGDGRLLSYLPFAHILERFLTHYSAFYYGTEVTFARNLEDLPVLLPQVKPFVFGTVPRVWEKFYAGIVAKLDEEPNERKRKLGLLALEVAEKKGKALTEGHRADLRTEILHALFERLVYGKIRQALGFDECLAGFSGAAPIQAKLLHMFTGLGIPLAEAYGMTESHAIMTVTPIGRPRVGTVGLPLTGSEIKIAEDSEICFRGPHVTPGYLNRTDATSEAIDEDGWFHTGDLGEFDDAGYLKIIGRKKELIITAAGKNLSPNNIEEEVKSTSPLISQVCAIGDERKFISALIVLDPEILPAWCKSEGVPFDSLSQASQEPSVRKAVQLAVDAANEKLARVEQVKKFTILDKEWTPEDPEMTPSMKLKRSVIHEIHKDAIDAMYED